MAIAGLYECFNHWHKNGTVWLYSDTHFGDKELLNRPTDEEQIKMINSKVGKYDTLILLGDVGNIECAKRLKGYKILICGNHDVGHTAYKRQIVKKRFDQDIYTREEAIAAMSKDYPNCIYSVIEGFQFHDPYTYWEITADNKLFDEVYTGPLMIGEKLILSHEPLGCTWAYNIHGHAHYGAKKGTYSFNCCAEAIDFTPVNFNQWMKQGHLAAIKSIHRTTINKATERSRKRGGKKNR